MTSFVIFLLPLAVLLFLSISIYNRLVALKNRYQNGFSQIDIQLKRRYDLIPNLVEIAKGYLKHERETLEAVIGARNQAMLGLTAAKSDPSNSGAIQELARAEGQLSSAMGRLNVVMEAYPELKANQTISELMEELASTENRVGFARQAFNDAVMFYNTACQSFPSNLIANRYAFGPAELLQIDNPEERKAVRVAF